MSFEHWNYFSGDFNGWYSGNKIILGATRPDNARAYSRVCVTIAPPKTSDAEYWRDVDAEYLVWKRFKGGPWKCLMTGGEPCLFRTREDALQWVAEQTLPGMNYKLSRVD